MEKDPRNGERIFFLISAVRKLNTSPTHTCHRYAINFEDFPLERKAAGHSWFQLTEGDTEDELQSGVVAHDYPGPVASDWPDLIGIVIAKVKPERVKQKRDANRERWWQFAEKRPGLTRALKRSCLAHCSFSSGSGIALAFTFLDAAVRPSEKIVVIYVRGSYESLAVMQSRVHDIWARFS